MARKLPQENGPGQKKPRYEWEEEFDHPFPAQNKVSSSMDPTSVTAGHGRGQQSNGEPQGEEEEEQTVMRLNMAIRCSEKGYPQRLAELAQ